MCVTFEQTYVTRKEIDDEDVVCRLLDVLNISILIQIDLDTRYDIFI